MSTPDETPALDVARERAHAGATWLDGRIPNWRNQVNLTTLNLVSAQACILGQVFEHDARERAEAAGFTGFTGFDYATNTIFAEDWEEVITKGFTIPDSDDLEAYPDLADAPHVTFDDLQAAWREILEEGGPR